MTHDRQRYGAVDISITSVRQFRQHSQPASEHVIVIIITSFSLLLSFRLYVCLPCPSRATAGPGKPLSRGPITISFGMHRDNIRRRRREEGNWGEVSHHHLTRCLVERRNLPEWGLGRSPGRKWILCIFEVRKKPHGTPFSVCLSDCASPQRRLARENSPLSTGLLHACMRACLSVCLAFPAFRCLLVRVCTSVCACTAGVIRKIESVIIIFLLLLLFCGR